MQGGREERRTDGMREGRKPVMKGYDGKQVREGGREGGRHSEEQEQ